MRDTVKQVWARVRGLSRMQWVALIAAFAVIAGSSFLLGYVGGKYSVVGRLRDWAVSRLGEAPSAEAERVARTEIVTAYHVLDIVRFPIGRAQVIAEVGGHIVFSTRHGQLNALIGDRVVTLPLHVPIGLEQMRATGRTEDDSFDLREFRVTDLLAVETGPGAYDLFAAGVHFEPDCVRLAVHRIGLAADAESVTPASEDWDEFFRTQECLAIPVPGGSQSGGRLVQASPDSLLLSVGSFGLEAPLMDERTPSEYGTIYTLPLDGGAPRVFARGFRNPQGLLLTSSGEVWETEHGPNGGDELNRVRPGDHHGWPFVTYGMAYAGRPTPWPHNPEIGGHPNFTPPRYAWLPSIGVSQLIEPDTREFPNWGEHLLVASLRAQNFYLLRLEGDRVALSEPIAIGERIRDVISLSDGRLAFSTDKGDIHFIRNGEREEQRPVPEVLQLAEMGPLPPEEELGGSPLRIGGVTFATQCGNCHSLNGQAQGGPPLNGLIGRRVGSVADFQYSSALSGRDERWTRDRLRQFLTDVQATYPGTSMPPAALYSDYEIDLVVDYLVSKSETP